MLRIAFNKAENFSVLYSIGRLSKKVIFLENYASNPMRESSIQATRAEKEKGSRWDENRLAIYDTSQTAHFNRESEIARTNDTSFSSHAYARKM